MKWKKITKDSNNVIPDVTDHIEYKPQLSIEGHHQCVYCAIREADFGGYRNFHVEHFRPKSLDRFKHLALDYFNLFYACSICNGFKSNDWPGDPCPDLSTPCYPNPLEVDYSHIINTQHNSVLEGKNPAAQYLIERLYLNRPQLILERKKYRLLDRFNSLKYALQGLVEELENSPFFGKEEKTIARAARNKILAIYELIEDKDSIPPYEPSDTKRAR